MTDVAPLSRLMTLHIKSLYDPSNHGLVPWVTARALASRGLVVLGEAVQVADCGRAGLVRAKLSQAGENSAFDLLWNEHASRVTRGETSERIPRIFARRGISIQP